MDFDFDELRAGFGDQSRVFVDLVNATFDLSTSTRLEGWDCAVLVGHVSTAVEALWRWQGEPPPDVPEIDAVAPGGAAWARFDQALATRIAR